MRPGRRPETLGDNSMNGSMSAQLLKQSNRGRLQWLHGLSIGTRLAVGFGLIAALFLVANFLSQQHAASVTARIETSNRASRNLDHATRSLAEALTGFHRAVRERIAVDNVNGTQQRYSAADAALSSAVEGYAQIETPISGTMPADRLAADVQSLQSQVSALLASAKRRDDLLNQYWRDLDRLHQQLIKPQQDAWRMGDRALTRRSITQIADALVAVHTAVGAYLSSPNAQRAVTIELQEENFLVALAANSRALTAAEGEAWVKAVRNDFGKLRRLQRSARQARDSTQGEFAIVSGNVDALANAIRKGISDPATKALLESAKLAGEIARRTDRDIAYLSIVTLGLILAISLLTVVSVARPVQRLSQAAYRLGSGDEATRVQRGGVRELDQLAGAFNEMADQLAEARRGVREQQAQLEERVAARTEQLQHLAYHDALTQLPNRRHLFKHLSTVLERARSESRSVVLLLLDLDNFKTLNDSLGHLFGDRVLKAVSERLLAAVDHNGFAARLGGDEFTIVCELPAAHAAIAEQTDKLMKCFQQPLRVDDREIMVGMSVGAGVFPEHATNAESLLRAADSALFRAKSLGRNQACIASADLVEQVSAQFKTEQALRRAIQNGELELLYQPQAHLRSRQVNSVEALLRWRRDGAYALPLDFLPLAEQSGLITEIADWVLANAVQKLAEWHHGLWPQARVAVNISAQQFIDRTFVTRLQSMLVAHNVPVSSLELELTETVLQSGAATIRTLGELRELGVGIALDDFGAGYSSLASLDKLPLSRVKIDRSLMENVDRHPRSAGIAHSMIDLCRSLDLQVTAEGIERLDQLRFLHRCGDVDVQGFLLARPMIADNVVASCAALSNQLTKLLDDDTDGQNGSRIGRNVSHLPRRTLPRP
jgi:diguanylate cyclase (GGDEF)-like protein